MMIQLHRFIKVMRDHNHTGLWMKTNDGRESWVFPITMNLEKTHKAQLLFFLKGVKFETIGAKAPSVIYCYNKICKTEQLKCFVVVSILSPGRPKAWHGTDPTRESLCRTITWQRASYGKTLSSLAGISLLFLIKPLMSSWDSDTMYLFSSNYFPNNFQVSYM